MENTRERILLTAKRLFNERGYNAVSLREVSDALGISKGNLTYYFKKKEDIIEAIIEENAVDYHPPQAPATLAETDALLLHIQNVVRENAFYFWNHAQLSALSETIRQRQRAMFRINRDVFLRSFLLLRQNGMFSDELFAGQYENLAEALLLACIYRIPFDELRNKAECNDSLRAHAWGLLRPLLTKKGREQAEPILNEIGLNESKSSVF